MTYRVPIEGTPDLHTFAPRDVAAVVADYVAEAHSRGFAEVRLIHGRGIGVQHREPGLADSHAQPDAVSQ